MSDQTPTPVDTRQRDLRILVLSGIAGIALGWFAATSPSSPVRPEPDRPILRFLAKAAKTALWVMVVADPPPPESSQYVVHARVGDDGHKVLNHSEGW